MVSKIIEYFGLVRTQECMDEEWWAAAWQLFQTYDDKEWPFTDCTSFILMQRRIIRQAFAFDRHFEQAGFQLWPG